MIIDFDEFLDQGHLPDCEHIYICLGTTIKKAGSQESFKKVDLDYCLGFAKKARESGATTISLVTSIGANADSKNFYLKTKGKLENEIKTMGFDSVNIFHQECCSETEMRSTIRVFGSIWIISVEYDFIRTCKEIQV